MNYKSLNQEFDSEVLELVKQKGFYPYEYMIIFEKFKEGPSIKDKFDSSLTGKRSNDNNYEYVFKFGTNLKWKLWKPIMICP